ncbi:MAG TPA: type II toxin-antitoxin system RelE/ParE family toxin [Pirellulaceae bacterium]|nr:type II toxin-antitoxin system RelE/ParE family toxin [Pirellulaceae bacterium]
MKYTVIWKPSALDRLTEIWLAAEDKDGVSRAVTKIDQFLGQQSAAGESYFEGTRLIVAPPLVVVYEVDHGDRRATVSRVAYRP